MRNLFFPYGRTLSSRLRTAGIIVIIGLAGYGAVRATHAAPYKVSSEAETAQVAGQASYISAPDASNAAAVRFGDDASLNDGFDGTGLSSYWTFENPSGNSALTVANGAATMSVAGNNDQWINIDKAPRLLKAQPASSNWTIETRLYGNTGPAASYAALTVFKDAANHLDWGQQGAGSLDGSGIINNAFTETFASMASKYEYLRIRKTGHAYYLDGSVNGANWNNANVYQDTTGALDGARVGVLAKSWTPAGYDVKLDYYKEYAYDAMPSPLLSATSRQISKQTGWDAINDTRAANFCGTDLGEMFHWNNKVYSVFGDTNRCDNKPFPSNVMSYTTDTNPSDGIKYDGWVGGGSELFPEDPGNVTAIPTAGFGSGANGYIYYMDVNNWSPPAPNKWTCSQSSIASALSSNDAAWTKHPGTISWSGTSNFGVDAVWQDGSTLYVWGVPCGRFGSVRLMKVDVGSILNKGAYRYMSGYTTDGTPQWSADENAAITVAGGPVGELSVIYNKWLGRYVMTYLDERKAAIVMRTSPTPWGNWSAPTVLASGSDYPQLYGGFMDPQYVENDGQSVYWMMSMFGPYNTYLMKTTLTKAS